MKMEYLQMFCLLAVTLSIVLGVMLYFNDEEEWLLLYKLL